MEKRVFFALFLIVSVFLIVPLIIQGVDIDLEKISDYLDLPQNKAKNLINLLFDELNKKWVDLMTSADSTSQEQAALIVARKAVRKNVINYAFWELPKQAGKDLVGAIYKTAILIGSPDKLVKLLDEFEKMTVGQAKKYATEWLLQQEIKVSTGNLKTSYISCAENKQEIILPYVIAYKPISPLHGKVGITVYSGSKIEPPISQGDPLSIVFNDFWLAEDEFCKILMPFTIHVIGTVEQGNSNLYKWVGQPEIKIEFPDYVPQLDFPELSWIDKINQGLKQNLVVIDKLIKITKDFSEGVIKETAGLIGKSKSTAEKIFKKIETIIQDNELWPGTISSVPNSILQQELDKLSYEQDLISNESEQELDEEKETEKEVILTIEQQDFESKILAIQKELDVIANQIDIITEKIAQLKKDMDYKEVAGAVTEEQEPEQEPDQEICKKTNLSKPAQNKVIINEVAWMGTSYSSSDEWIELKNLSNNPVDLTGWQILDKENQIKIVFKQNGFSPVIPSNGFFLLERTSEQTVSFKKADIIYTGALSNNNEALYLFNNHCQLQDKVIANPSWPAGDNQEKRTMERSKDLSWHTFSAEQFSGILGTPKAKNSEPLENKLCANHNNCNNQKDCENAEYYWYDNACNQYKKESDNSNTAKNDTSGSDTPIISYCSQENLGEPSHFPVIVNEIAWMGTNNSYTDEWIELKNISENTISLNNWQLLDKDLNIQIIFNAQDFIAPNEFYILERTNDDSAPDIVADKIYSGNLSNENESLRLFNENCDLIDHALAEPDWPAGDNSEKRTMERSADLSWHTFSREQFSGILGTPKAKNSEPAEPEEQEPSDYDNQQDCENAGYYWYDEICNSEQEVILVCADYNNETDCLNESCYWYSEICNQEQEEQEQSFSLLDVVINEIAWMGTQFSSNDEWIELYNNTDQNIDLNNWTIKSKDETPNIVLTGVILSNSFYLLERTDDSAISDILADQIYTGALGNEGEYLELRDAQNNLIDEVDCANDWFAGDNENKTTMERIDTLSAGSNIENWANNAQEIKNGLDAESNPINGTPKTKNSASQNNDLVWNRCQENAEIDENETYEQVLLSMIKGSVQNFQIRTFTLKVGQVIGEFYINANTRAYNQFGAKISDEQDFSFSDYLIPDQKVKTLYADYGQFCIASEVWLEE